MRRKEARKRQRWGLPWFREQDLWWYLTLNGKQDKLARGRDNRAEADVEWHKLMATARVEETKEDSPVWAICSHYLDHIQRDRPGCYEQYRRFLQLLKDVHGDLTINAV